LQEAHDGVEIVLMLNDIFADLPFGTGAEKRTVRQYHRHRTVVSQMMEHMRHKGIVRSTLRGKSPILRETVIMHESRVALPFPLCRKRRIGDNRLGFEVSVHIFRKRITMKNREVIEWHPVEIIFIRARL
jgi:hypothetical protein